MLEAQPTQTKQNKKDKWDSTNLRDSCITKQTINSEQETDRITENDGKAYI